MELHVPIPLALWMILASVIIQLVHCDPYYGKYVGDFRTYAHLVSGSVYAVSDTKLYIRSFTYDGRGPDAFAWMGSSSGSTASSQGVIIPVNKSSNVLGPHSNSVVELDLPMGTILSDYKWISIWCRRFSANFADLIFDTNLEAPAEHSLGPLGFSPRVHNVYADNVIIENERQIRIVSLDYDGGGPEAYYWAGTGSTPTTSGFALIEDSSKSTNPLPRVPFNDKTVQITFPNGTNIFDVDHFGLWCKLARQDFGHVDIPADLNIPVFMPSDDVAPTTPMAPMMGNCEVLIPDKYHVMWSITDSTIEIALSGRIANGDYLAFGLSGSSMRTLMIGSDVTVAWLDKETGTQANVVDYAPNQYGQCIVGTGGVGSGTGACPDELSSTPSSNDVELVDFSNNDGITTISYTRQLDTGDTIGDKVIPTDQEVYIAWAVGPIFTSGLAARHSLSPTKDFKINFGRASSSCPAFTAGQVDVLDPWENVEITKTTQFVADMGQAGGQQGYEGITGSPGWGIAWYINSEMIPIITMIRGTTYTFEVNGGDNQALPAAYHPFYITNDPEGGYAQKSTAERQGVVIYAGPTEGSLCEWRSVVLYNPDIYPTFEEYRDQALERQCDGNSPGTLTWMPDENTPDRVYYQCYTHKFLGWKINIVDPTTSDPPDTTDTTGNLGRTDPPDTTDTTGNIGRTDPPDTTDTTGNIGRTDPPTTPVAGGGSVTQGHIITVASMICLSMSIFTIY